MSKRQKIHDIKSDDIKSTYLFDMLYSKTMAFRFIKLYHPLIKPYIKFDKTFSINDDDVESDGSDSFVAVFENYIKIVVEYELWKKVNYPSVTFDNDEYKLGESVNIEYSPFSQKYLDYYDGKAFTGIIIFVDVETENMLLIELPKNPLKLEKDEHKFVIKSLEQDGCDFLGLHKGYCYTIKHNGTSSRRARSSDTNVL
jgi:hypothetical protein